jgi:hypothetical protein
MMTIEWRAKIAQWLWADGFAEATAAKTENADLRLKLLKALKACEDAGKHGLELYADNERLRENAATVLGADEICERLKSRAALLEYENLSLRDQLNRAIEDYNRLFIECQEWIKNWGSK